MLFGDFFFDKCNQYGGIFTLKVINLLEFEQEPPSTQIILPLILYQFILSIFNNKRKKYFKVKIQKTDKKYQNIFPP